MNGNLKVKKKKRWSNNKTVSITWIVKKPFDIIIILGDTCFSCILSNSNWKTVIAFKRDSNIYVYFVGAEHARGKSLEVLSEANDGILISFHIYLKIPWDIQLL